MNNFVDILSTIGGLVLVVDFNVCTLVPGGVVKLVGTFSIDVVGELSRDCVALDWVGFVTAFKASSYNFS